MKPIVIMTVSALLLVSSIAATCQYGRSGPLPPPPPPDEAVPTYSFDPEASEGPVPDGFASWTEFVEWEWSLLYNPDGTAKDQGGGSDGAALLNEGLPPPGLITQPDGSEAIWMGEIPEGYVVFSRPDAMTVCQINADKTGCIEGTIITKVLVPQ